MSPSALEYLHHIRDEADYILRATQDFEWQMFEADPTLRRAIVRSLEIIGEATKRYRPTCAAVTRQ